MAEELDTSPTPTFEASLLNAMLGLLRRGGVNDAVVVTGYKERSYNIGYCETCAELVTEVRIYYLRRDGSPGQWDYCGDLGELIRALTDQPDQHSSWDRTAVRESQDERWDRWNTHSFDEEVDVD